MYLSDHGELHLASGNTLTTLKSFPSKAHPVSDNKITLLSVHYNTFNENNSELYCNGKQIDRFITESTTGENTFSIGSATSKVSSRNTHYKRIYYFSLFHNYFLINYFYFLFIYQLLFFVVYFLVTEKPF